MQKKATQALHMPGERIMKIAEELYQAGFISYPRTETDSFPPSQDLMVSLSLCLAHSQSDLLQQQQNILSILITCCCHTDKAVYNMTWHSPASSRMSTAGMTSQNFIHTHMGHKAAMPGYHNRRQYGQTCLHVMHHHPCCTVCLLLLNTKHCISHQQLMHNMCRPW